MNLLRGKWQLIGCSLLVGCGPVMAPVDAGVMAPADAGEAVDGGSVVDAGVDAGVSVNVPMGWSRTANTPGANGLWGTMLAFDPVERRFILHGGNRFPNGAVENETWSFSIASGSWTRLMTTGTVPVRYCHCTTYLPAQRQVLIAGGRDSGGLVDSAYTLDLTTLAWTKIDGVVPTGAIGCVAHWMPMSGRAVVFGGDGAGGVNNRTFTYDPAARTFTQAMPAMSAPARRDPMSIVDPARNRIALFGGARAIRSSYLDDVATFDGATWATIAPAGARPAARRYGASGLDPLRDRWILFGGTNDADDFGDLWTIDPSTFTFTQQQLPGAPSARGFSASGVDPSTGVLYVFGGLIGTTASSAEGFTLRLP